MAFTSFARQSTREHNIFTHHVRRKRQEDPDNLAHGFSWIREDDVAPVSDPCNMSMWLRRSSSVIYLFRYILTADHGYKIAVCMNDFGDSTDIECKLECAIGNLK